MNIKDLKEYENFEKSLKSLLNAINNDIITMNFDCKKSSNNITVRIIKEEKFNLYLK